MRYSSLIAAIVLSLACREGAPRRLEPGNRFEAMVVVTQRAPLITELRETMRATSDSLRIPFAIDSVRGDSAFGAWYADLRPLGTAGDYKAHPRPLPLRAEQRHDSVVMVLNPEWTDQDVWLRGEWVRDTLRGEWETAYSPHVAGTFVVQRGASLTWR